MKKIIIPSTTDDANYLDRRIAPIFARWLEEKRAEGDTAIYTMYRWYVSDSTGLAPFYTVVIEVIEDTV